MVADPGSAWNRIIFGIGIRITLGIGFRITLGIGIRIKVKIQELQRLKMKPSRLTVEA
jgi:hypothetical protein